MTMTTKERHDLYVEYIRELNTFLTVPITPDEIEYGFNQQNTSYDIMWKDIFYEKKRVGFVIFATGDLCHPDTDYFIVNTFVKWQYRRKHLASDTVRQFLAQYPGRYSLDIINRNFVAMQFWEHTFRECGYVPLLLRYIPHNEGPGIATYGWAPAPKGENT